MMDGQTLQIVYMDSLLLHNCE